MYLFPLQCGNIARTDGGKRKKNAVVSRSHSIFLHFGN